MWTRHARFHRVWQAITYALLSVLEIALIVTPGPFPAQRFYLAAVLGSNPMLSCPVAFMCRKAYGGALSDPNGVPPVSIIAFASEYHIDLNITAEVLALFALLANVILFSH
jgi:hypothetical protein